MQKYPYRSPPHSPQLCPSPRFSRLKQPRRPRRLLAHKSEIRHLQQQIKLQGYTLVPLQLYFKQGRVKVELGLCNGKKLYDKRADAAARDAKRDIDRAIKTRR